MSSTSYAAPLRIELRSSTLFFLLLFVAHVGAMSICFLLTIPLHFQLILVLIIAIAAYQSINRYALLKAGNAIVKVNWNGYGDWSLMTNNGLEYNASLQNDTFVHPNLTVLNFKREDNKKCSVVIFPDMIDKEIFRQLRVRLKLDKNKEQKK